MKFGQVELNNFEACKLPQEAASAWSATMNEIVGIQYRALLYCGEQIVKGVNHWFIAEMEMVLATPQRHIVLLCINEFDGDYKLVKESIEVII